MSPQMLYKNIRVRSGQKVDGIHTQSVFIIHGLILLTIKNPITLINCTT